MRVLASVIPIFIVLLIGYIGQKRLKLDIKSISTGAIYMMYPFLAFQTFYTHPLTKEYLYIFLFCILLCCILVSVVLIFSRIRKASRSTQSALMLGSVFMNAGNYGSPIILFALGEEAFSYAVIFMVTQSILMNTIGLFIATQGGKEKVSYLDSVKKVLSMPILYGAFGGFLLQSLGVELATTITQTISFIAQATIPTILIVLGMQLSTIVVKKVDLGNLTFGIITKLIISPLVGLFLILILPLTDTLRNVVVLMSFMPTAANTTMFALQFENEPDLVSLTTLITTLISPITLVSVLYFMV